MRRTLCVSLLLATGCSRAVAPPLDVKVTRERKAIHTLAVMPVAASPQTAGDAAARAPQAVTMLLGQAAAGHPEWTVVSAERVANALRAIPAAEPVESKAGLLAARVGADATVTATVATYTERVGTDYGASEPASVSLQVLVIPSGQKQAVWKANYTFTQEPLAYNLFNFWGVLRGGPKWLTADQLARIGIDEAMKRLAETNTAVPSR